jgi:large subunit ribosomal protein L24
VNIRKDDVVFIRTGVDKGKTGKVLFINKEKKRVVVEGVNMRKKHQKPTQQNQKGGIISIEGSLHISNVALYNSSTNKPEKIKMAVVGEGNEARRVRVFKFSGEEI